MSVRLAGSARLLIAALSIGLGTAACGSGDDPATEQSDPVTVLDTPGSSADASSATDAPAAAAGRPTSTAPVSGVSGASTTTMSAADTTPTTMSATDAAQPGLSEADVTELEQQLDEIDRVLADLEAQLSGD